MVGSLILRGLIAGIVAGLFAFGFARTFGEPAVNVAINFEAAQGEAKDAAAAAAGHHHDEDEHELFSRNVQSGAGLLTGLVAVGAGIGGIFGVMFAFANGRMGDLGPGATSARLAFYALWSAYVIPALKYPANPPATSEPETIALRTGLYFLLMAISIATTIGALILRKNLTAKHGAWNGSVLAFAVYVAVICAFFALLPNINETPGNFPAITLYDFRLASLGIQVVLWAVTGLIFGYFAEREMSPRTTHGRTPLGR